MADIKTPEQRSLNMSHIRSKDTKPEEYIRKLLFKVGYRYRKNYSGLPGHPDAWLAHYRTAVFVNGCFWHRHTGCKYAYIPKSRSDFWNAKFTRNTERDRDVDEQLEALGIRTLVIWECTVRRMMKDFSFEKETIDRISIFLHSAEQRCEI